MIHQVKKTAYIVLGSVFLVIGAIGIFVPILPTTPFWLLTCWFYIHSSGKLYGWVMKNKYFGPYMKGIIEDREITLYAKVISLTVMWGSAILTSVFLIKQWWIIVLLFLISICVTIYLLSFKTKKA